MPTQRQWLNRTNQQLKVCVHPGLSILRVLDQSALVTTATVTAVWRNHPIPTIEQLTPVVTRVRSDWPYGALVHDTLPGSLASSISAPFGTMPNGSTFLTMGGVIPRFCGRVANSWRRIA